MGKFGHTLLLVGVYTFLEKESCVSFTCVHYHRQRSRQHVKSGRGALSVREVGSYGYCIIKHNYIHSEYMMLTI